MKIDQDYEKWAILPSCITKAQATLGATVIEVVEDDDDDEMNDYAMTEENGVAIIPVAGVIGHKVSPIAKMLGAVDTLDVICLLYTSPSPRD